MDKLIEISDIEFDLLRKYIKENFGISLGDEKKSLVTGRMGSRIAELGFDNFTDYYRYLESESNEEGMVDLVNRITTNHTFFMREFDHFEFFGKVALPWIERSSKDMELRIWSAGCSSGQEPYTLAMVVDQFFKNRKGFWKTDILATDISTKVLKQAKDGIYSKEAIAPFPDVWKDIYLKKTGDSEYVISDELKKELVIRRFNLMEKRFPFKKKFQVIFCRNVMIYFDNVTKEELVEKFYNSIEDGGYLFIGKTESLGSMQSRFKYIKPSIYRKE